MRTNESGFTLIGVLAVFTIISVFSISLVMLSISSVKTSNTEHDDQSVFYIAEAGANYMVNEIEQKAHATYDTAGSTKRDDFYKAIKENIKEEKNREFRNFVKNGRGEQPKADISVELLPTSDSVEYKITSIGIIGDQSRTVDQTISIGWPSGGENDSGGNDSGGTGLLPPFAVFANGGKMNFQNKVTIKGNIGTSSPDEKSIELEELVNIENGNIYVPKGTNNVVRYDDEYKKINDIIGGSEIIGKDIEKPFPNMPVFLKPDPGNEVVKFKVEDNGINEITEDIEYDNVKLENKEVIKIRTKGKDISVTMKALDMQNTSSIRILGNGTVTLYIHNKIDLQNSSTINLDGNINQLNIYSKGKIDMQDSSTIFGSVYVEDGDIELQNNSSLQGNIFLEKGKIDIEDQAIIRSEIILAPESTIKIQDNPKIEGIIIGKEFNIQGGTLNQSTSPLLNLKGPLSLSKLLIDFKWPDLGQGDNGSGGNSTLPTPNGGPTFTSTPIKEIQNNN